MDRRDQNLPEQPECPEYKPVSPDLEESVSPELQKQLDAADGNFISRKFLFAVGTSALIFIGGILSGVWKLFGNNYSELVYGLLGVLGIYLGSNVSSRYVTGKHLAAMSQVFPDNSRITRVNR
jgi:hypothetical protein